MNLSGNTILITGGATGIGFALAAELVPRGNEVIICGRRQEKLDEAKRQLPSITTRVADLSKHDEHVALAEWLTSTFPRLNIVVNNAGVQHTFSAAAGTRDLGKAEEEIATNLLAPIHLTALLTPHLAAQPHAAIVNVSSGLGFTPLAHMPVYCATKAALHSLSLSLRHQLRDTTVRVFELIPPIVATELGAAHRPPELNAHAMTVEAAAKESVEALEQDRFEAPLGEAINLVTKREGLFGALNSRY
jgi:uncharacterized oxidoreductase